MEDDGADPTLNPIVADSMSARRLKAAICPSPSVRYPWAVVEEENAAAMTTHIALLRGVNVGGHKKVAMSDLRDFITELGFDDVRSLIQSGNLVFQGGVRTGADLERMLEDAAQKRLDLRTTFFVRTAKEWMAIIAHNPFSDAAENDPNHLVVMCLKDTPPLDAVQALQDAIKGPEVVRVEGSHLYIVYPAGIGRSKLTLKLIEAKLGTQGTGRNWNTVQKLAVLAQA